MRTTSPGVRLIVLIAVITSFSTPSFSQSISSGNGKYEFGLGLGPLFFLGDLGGNQGIGTSFVKDVNLPLTKLSKGLFLNIYPAEWLGFRVAFNHGMLEGDDSRIPEKTNGAEQFRRIRNLKFKTSMMEVYTAAEFYPSVFFEKYDGLQGKLRPYGIAGIGLMKFNPKGEYFDNTGKSSWVELQPLRLEGQGMKEYPDRKEYQLSTVEIPMGLGAKYYIKESMYIGFEVLHRKTFTDYIDDVSTNYIESNLFAQYLTGAQIAMANQLYYREGFVPGGTTKRPDTDEQRGDPKENDSFFSTILRFGWRLNDSNSPNGRAARQMRCPSFY
ncbi:MAG TPA: hypothetical protein VEY06_04570 [Flavisolibacter sp.]|jgi:hypothetical protein|nr:hypothetical protein [Flavisolibacter sp.]